MFTWEVREILLAVKELVLAGREVLNEENPYSEGAPEYLMIRVHWNHDFIDPQMVPSPLMHHIGAAGEIVKVEFEVSVDDDFSERMHGGKKNCYKDERPGPYSRWGGGQSPFSLPCDHRGSPSTRPEV
jgi:hypothetical protein